jgi:FkbM family methyltransferase
VLVYDVGMHKGEDTAFYLALGHSVVAFEADPRLVEHCQRRFASFIDDRRLTIVSGAITSSGGDTVRFYQHPNSVWGTTSTDWVKRNEVFAPSVPIDVPAVRFAEVLKSRGVPNYLKIDIEGADLLCLTALESCTERPKWVSLESDKRSWETLLSEFGLLEKLGYDRFAVIQQGTIPGRVIETRAVDGSIVRFRFEADASGTFGRSVGPWLDREAALEQYRRVFLRYRHLGEESMIHRVRIGRVMLGRLQKYLRVPLPGWYDTHACRSDAA